MLTKRNRFGIIYERSRERNAGDEIEQDFGAIRTLKIKQRKKRNLDKNLSTESTNQIQISETKQGKDNDS